MRNTLILLGSITLTKQHSVHNSNVGLTQSIQRSSNEAALIGNYNTIDQNSQQHNIQNQSRANMKRHYYPYSNR